MKDHALLKRGTLAAAIAVVALVAGPTGATPYDPGTWAPVRSVDGVRLAPRNLVRPPPGAPEPLFLRSSLECKIGPSRTSHANVNLDCDAARLPNNETHIVVDPNDPEHIVVTAHDYDSNGHQFYVTFDAGRHWRTGEMASLGPYRIASDPVTAIDPVTGNVMHSELNYLWTSDGLADGHVVVSVSTDGGIHWRKPRIVAEGKGDDDDRRQIFNDKEWIATDTFPGSPHFGRTYLVWAEFRSRYGNYRRSPIVESHSDDGGFSWSKPQAISGSNPVCTWQLTGPDGKCDEAEAPTIAVQPDGDVFVAFLSPQNRSIWEQGERLDDTYFVVRSTNGGKAWSDPVVAATMEDGKRDFPKNVQHRRTLTGYQLRIPTFGNITASPLDGRLYLVFTDNRNGKHDVDRPRTKTDVFVASSAGGIAWSAPTPVIDKASDQWFPFADVDPVTGDLGVIFHDRRLSNRDLYDTRLAVGTPGSFTYTRLSTKPSNPVRSAHFRAGTAGCRRCATFHGDYIGLDFGSDGAANAVWTDMRRRVAFAWGRGRNENVYFRRVA
ncbi:MAG TPA: sialidase family protein [Actinomycetota bacterium]|nr:sialidase family protein [Actinomycetota bacterium]